MRFKNMPHDMKSLTELVDKTLEGLQKKDPKSHKDLLQIKLLNKIKNILTTPVNGLGFLNAIKCLEDGGFFKYSMVRLLVKLLPETSCGHFAVVSALNMKGKGISFLKFIDLLTRGILNKNGTQLCCINKDFSDMCPTLYGLASISFKKEIDEKGFLHSLKENNERDGIYLFAGEKVQNNEGHMFMLIIANGVIYYSDSSEHGFHSDTHSCFPKMHYKNIYGSYIYPIDKIILDNLGSRQMEIVPLVTELKSTSTSEKPETIHSATTTQIKSTTSETSETSEAPEVSDVKKSAIPQEPTPFTAEGATPAQQPSSPLVIAANDRHFFSKPQIAVPRKKMTTKPIFKHNF